MSKNNFNPLASFYVGVCLNYEMTSKVVTVRNILAFISLVIPFSHLGTTQV